MDAANVNVDVAAKETRLARIRRRISVLGYRNRVLAEGINERSRVLGESKQRNKAKQAEIDLLHKTLANIFIFNIIRFLFHYDTNNSILWYWRFTNISITESEAIDELDAIHEQYAGYMKYMVSSQQRETIDVSIRHISSVRWKFSAIHFNSIWTLTHQNLVAEKSKLQLALAKNKTDGMVKRSCEQLRAENEKISQEIIEADAAIAAFASLEIKEHELQCRLQLLGIKSEQVWCCWWLVLSTYYFWWIIGIIDVFSTNSYPNHHRTLNKRERIQSDCIYRI